MKLLLLLTALLLGNACYSQSDTIKLNTPAKFSITFFEQKKSLFGLNKFTTYEEVYLDDLTKDFITIRKKFDDPKNPKAVSRYLRISLKDVKSVGYATGTMEVYSALLGLGSGAFGGLAVTAIGKGFDKGANAFNPGETQSVTGGILVGAVSGAIMGYIIGSHSNDYENFDLSSYGNDKKFEEIKRIVNKGLSYKKEK
jgi:hypothetical protein